MTTPYQTTEGTPLSGITVATFTDADNDPIGNYSATIVWGDPISTPGGNSSAGAIVANGSGGFTVTGSHTYVVPAAARIITVKIVDTDGSKATVFSRVKVADAPITATPVPVSGVKNSSIYAGVATFTDADPNATATSPATETALINWGDGTASAGVITEDPSSKVFTVLGKHTYLVAKTYTVTTTIHDREGTSKATAVTTATIVNPYPVTSPSLINDYMGKIKIGGILGATGSHSFEINITQQGLTYITGDILFDGATVVNGTLDAGVIAGQTDGELSNGNFIFTFSGSTSVTISGHISSDGTSITKGYILATGVPIPGFGKISGDFTATAS